MKLKSLLTCAALFLGGSLWAQTDVTSTYITNPSFEGTTYTFYTLQSGRTVIKPEGWSISYTQESTSDKNTQSFVSSAETMDNNQWSAISGKAYFFRCRWTNSTFDLRQTIGKLLPGNYTLKFYAKGVSGDGMTLQASVAGQNLNIPLVSDGTDALTQQSIDFSITSSTPPYATIQIHAAKSGGTLLKFALDDFTLWYDGSDYYSTLLTEAQALHDNNSDWAEDADALQSAIDAATGKSTVEDKNAAIFALQTAMQTFKNANTVDMTARLTNPNFDSNISGWVTTGSDGTWQRQTSTQNNFSGGFIETWRNSWNGTWNHKNLDMHQDLTSLPSGEYTIKAAIGAVMQGSSETQGSSAYGAHYHGGPYYVDDEHGAWLYATSGETTATTWANTENNNIVTGAGPEYFTTTINVTNGSLTIGAKAIGSSAGGTTIGTYTNWFSSDNWTLSYFGFDPSTLKAQISGLKDDVQAIIDGDEVPNAVKSSLQNTLDNLIETPETKSILDAAVSTLEGAIEAANATKAPYAKVKALITLATNEKDNSTGTKASIESAITVATSNLEDCTTEADFTSVYNTLEGVRETYVTGGAQPTAGNVFDFTFKINDAAVTGTSAWGTARTASGEQYTGAPDNTYMDIGWAQTYNMNQNVASLPAGSYTLKAATRAKSSEVTSANIYVNQSNTALNKSTDNHRDNNTGGELGNGWSWSNVDFVVLEAGAVTVGFYGQTTGQGWAGADDFHLYYKGAAPMHKEALLDVITSANTLYNSGANVGTGVFQIPESAGTDLDNAISDANDVYDDPDASASEITEAITTLQTAIETFNAAELNAPADGSRYYLKVATTGHAKENNAIVVSLGSTSANNPTGYGFAANASPAAHIAGAYIFTPVPEKTNTYFISVVRPEGTVYLTYGSLNGSAAGWQTQQIQGTTNAENKGEFKIVATSTANVFNIVNTVYEGTDNYIDCQDGGALYTDTNIDMKDFSLAEASQASVTVSCKAGKYGTVIFPFVPSVTAGSDVTFYTVTGVENGYVQMDEVAKADLAANTPYMIKNVGESLYEEPLTGWGTATADSYESNGLTGVYTTAAVPENSYVLQTQNDTQAFYKVSGTFEATAYKCYLTVSSNVKAFFFDINGEDGINEVKNGQLSMDNAEIFNLAGQRMNKLQKGVNIVNGKKYIVK